MNLYPTSLPSYIGQRKHEYTSQVQELDKRLEGYKTAVRDDLTRIMSQSTKAIASADPKFSKLCLDDPTTAKQIGKLRCLVEQDETDIHEVAQVIDSLFWS